MIRPVAKNLVPKNKSKFRLLEDPDSDSWKDWKIHGEKFTLYDDILLFRDTGVVFTLKGDIPPLITDYDSNETHSPDAKQVNNFLDEMPFDIHAKGKSSRKKKKLIL